MHAILLIDHGSHHPESNATVEEVARLVGDLVGAEVVVRFAHMDIASPDIPAAVAACVAAGATDIVAVPYMLAAGRHATVDIPRLVAEAVSRHPGVTHRVSAPLGVDGRLAELIVARAGLPLG